MKNQTFRPHYVISIEGRIFTIIMLFGASLMLFMSAKFAIVDREPVFIVYTIFMSAIFVGTIWVLNYYWQLFWGKLIITQESIQWRCLFCKSQRIEISEIQLFYVCAFINGNVVRNIDLYKTGYKYIVVSTCSKLQRPKKGHRVKSGNGVISFPYNERLQKALKEVLPNELKGRLYQVLPL